MREATSVTQEQDHTDMVYTAREAATFLKVSYRTLCQMLRRGAIRHSKIGRQYRISGRELARLMAGECGPGSPSHPILEAPEGVRDT